MAGGWFRVGDDRLGPERLRFDTVIDGHATARLAQRLGLLPDGRSVTTVAGCLRVMQLGGINGGTCSPNGVRP